VDIAGNCVVLGYYAANSGNLRLSLED